MKRYLGVVFLFFQPATKTIYLNTGQKIPVLTHLTGGYKFRDLYRPKNS